MENFVDDGIIDMEYFKDEETVSNNAVNKIITDLQLYSNNIEALTNLYTNILTDDNVVYILTRISQNPIFMKHFPEFYEKNANGESVINCQQNSIYHRFGVFKHILFTIENVGKDSLRYSSHDLKLLKWTMLLHDIGKPMAKIINSEGYDSFAGHDDLSVVIAERILNRFDFTEEDKRIILTLIKYHDRYLNEGDLTYDNLSFLAKELENKKDLFQFLIEVKIADNKAKSVDVYNKFMTVVGKYYDFANEYFSNIQDNEKYDAIEVDFVEESELLHKQATLSEERGVYKEGGSEEDLTEAAITQITKDVSNGARFKCYYQPVIDLKKKNILGYEIFYKFVTDEDFSYKQILRKAREFGKYDKIQQMLFVNSIEKFIDIKNNQKLTGFFNIDVKSYKNYINKARIFDMIEGNNIVFEFNNFETLINSEIKKLSDEIYVRKGMVLIDNFESSSKAYKDIEQIEPKYLKYRIENVEENTKTYLKELVTFTTLNSINLIVFGVDSKEFLDLATDCGVRYVQGEYFSKPTEGLDYSVEMLEDALDNRDEDLIV